MHMLKQTENAEQAHESKLTSNDTAEAAWAWTTAYPVHIEATSGALWAVAEIYRQWVFSEVGAEDLRRLRCCIVCLLLSFPSSSVCITHCCHCTNARQCGHRVGRYDLVQWLGLYRIGRFAHPYGCGGTEIFQTSRHQPQLSKLSSISVPHCRMPTHQSGPR